MYTENLPILRIHKLSQEQFDRELATGNTEASSLYLTPDESVDYVIAEDTDGYGWQYRKWASGIAECWESYTQLAANIAISDSPFEGFSYCRVGSQFPFTFVGTPVVYFNVRSDDSNAYCIKDKTVGSAHYFHTNVTDRNVNYSVYAIGRWK